MVIFSWKTNFLNLFTHIYTHEVETVKLKKYTIVLEVYLKEDIDESDDICEILDKAVEHEWYIDSKEEVEK